jgi:hypothetical protein
MPKVYFGKIPRDARERDLERVSRVIYEYKLECWRGKREAKREAKRWRSWAKFPSLQTLHFFI